MAESSFQVEVDRLNSDEWSTLFDLFDDANIYQTWSYGGVHWGEINLSHLVLKRDDEVVAMAQLRIVRPTRFKFGMAYLRWGPLVRRHGTPIDPTIPVLMARALEEEYVIRQRLFLRVLPNAFAGGTLGTMIQSAFCKFESESLGRNNTYRTFVLDLAPELEELRRKFDPKWRNKLSGAERNNLHVTSGNGDMEYQTFRLIYNQMRNRKTFDTTVDVEEFGRIQQNLPHCHRMRVLICRSGDVPVAGLVASAMGDTAIYLLGATSDDGLNAKGAYLLQWTLIKWLKENGFRWYDLGGIDPQRNPGVYSFKRGVSGVDVTQLSPLIACESLVSSAIVKTSRTMQQVIRASTATLRPMSSSLKSQVFH